MQSPFTQRFARRRVFIRWCIAPLVGRVERVRRAGGGAQRRSELLLERRLRIPQAAQRTCRAGLAPGAAVQRAATRLRGPAPKSADRAAERAAARARRDGERHRARHQQRDLARVALHRTTAAAGARISAEAGRGRLATMQRAIEDVAGTIERMREFYRPRESARALPPASPCTPAIDQVLELTQPRWRALPQERGIVIELRKDLAPAKARDPRRRGRIARRAHESRVQRGRRHARGRNAQDRDAHSRQ